MKRLVNCAWVQVMCGTLVSRSETFCLLSDISETLCTFVCAIFRVYPSYNSFIVLAESCYSALGNIDPKFNSAEELDTCCNVVLP